VTAETDSARPSAEVERTRRLYRRVVSLYDPFRSLWSALTRPAEEASDGLFRERIGPQTRILELAPGTGINIERLQRCAPEFASYLGIDSSEAMLANARARAGGDPRIELRLADATDLDGVSGRFDLIVSTWLLSHLDAPAETVRNACSRLAPGGTAAFVFFTRPRNTLLRGVLGRLGGPLRYRYVDAEAIAALPHLERIERCGGGMATLAVFRAPPAPGVPA
jgi:SAM-dependent methyltransferase